MRILLTLVLAMTIGACSTTADRPKTSYVKKNKVELVMLQHDVAFRNGARNPSKAESRKLDTFLQDIQAGPGDTLILDGGLAEQRIALGARLAYRNLTVRQTGEDGSPGRVTVHVERYVVTPPDCPDWSKPMGNDSENTPQPGFGCANTANLGMMVVNPRDLIHGSTPGPSDGEAVAAAIKRYREGKVTPLKQEDKVQYTLEAGGK